MLYDAGHGRINLALCGDLMPSRRLAVFREREFLALRELLCTTCIEAREGRGIIRGT
jgi:hypothetical protein